MVLKFLEIKINVQRQETKWVKLSFPSGRCLFTSFSYLSLKILVRLCLLSQSSEIGICLFCCCCFVFSLFQTIERSYVFYIFFFISRNFKPKICLFMSCNKKMKIFMSYFLGLYPIWGFFPPGFWKTKITQKNK